MKHAMLALLVCALMVSGSLEKSFFLADNTPICLIVVPDDADFSDLLTATQIAKQIVGLAGNGCPFSLIQFAKEITKEDKAKYNLILLGETGLKLKGKPLKVTEGLYLYENPFDTGREAVVVENPEALIKWLKGL